MKNETFRIQHLEYPFHHTILYNVFGKSILENIIEELTSLTQIHTPLSDKHHQSLLQEFKTQPFCLDNIYKNKREKSVILKATMGVTALRVQEHGASNPFLYYLPITNKDTTFVQRYHNGSSYENHEDGAVLTFLYPIKINEYRGGDLIFSRYNYVPHIPHNSCLIFPSYEPHQISEISSSTDQPVRYSINRRYYING